MATGQIKRLARDRGFGFIRPEATSNLLPHVGGAGRHLSLSEEGQTVEFDKGADSATRGRAVAQRPRGELTGQQQRAAEEHSPPLIAKYSDGGWPRQGASMSKIPIGQHTLLRELGVISNSLRRVIMRRPSGPYPTARSRNESEVAGAKVTARSAADETAAESQPSRPAIVVPKGSARTCAHARSGESSEPNSRTGSICRTVRRAAARDRLVDDRRHRTTIRLLLWPGGSLPSAVARRRSSMHTLSRLPQEMERELDNDSSYRLNRNEERSAASCRDRRRLDRG